MERRLDDMYANRLELPRAEFRSEEQHVLHAAAIVVRRYEIPRQYFLELAEGCRADSAVQRYATWAALEKHCCQTSGVVALMMSCVLGVAHSDAGQYAAALGNALRLTNILRDIKQDISRGRVYLPLEDMVRFNYSERDLAGGVVNRNLRALIRFQVDRARQLYQHAADGICWLAGEGARLLAAIVIVQHGEILDAIERRQFDVRSVESSWPRMMMRLGRVRNLARRQPGEPLPRVI